MSKYNNLEERIRSLEGQVENLKKRLNQQYITDSYWSHSLQGRKKYPTIRGEVDAIIEHLGLDISVKNEQPAEIKVRLMKKTKK